MITTMQKPYKPEQIDHILNPIVKKWFFTRFKEYSLPQLHGVMEIHSFLDYFLPPFKSASQLQLSNYDFLPLDIKPTGHSRVRYLNEKNQLHSFIVNNYRFKMILIKNNQKNKDKIVQLPQKLERELLLKIHKFTLNIRAKRQVGQTTISREIKKQFGIDVSESTVSGWIHKHVVPYGNEKTQFKLKPMASEKVLYDFYVQQNLSATTISKEFDVSDVTVASWLRKCGIKSRTHTESMNTPNIKEELANLRYKRPTTNYQDIIPEKAYILSVLSGDGYIDRLCIKFEIRKDEEFIKEFSRCLEKIYGLKYNYIYRKKKNTFLLNVSSMLVSKDLLRYGNFRTFSWNVPQEILNSNNKEIISSYLRGIYDSEGTVGKYCVSITSASYKGLVGISKLLKKLSIESRLKKSKYSTLYIGKKINRELFKDLVGFTIKRKMQKLREACKLGW